jgi:hypothetical protein
MYIFEQSIYKGAGYDSLNIQFKTPEEAEKYKSLILKKFETYIRRGCQGKSSKEETLLKIEEVKNWKLAKV